MFCLFNKTNSTVWRNTWNQNVLTPLLIHHYQVRILITGFEASRRSYEKLLTPNVHTDLDKLDTLINCISSDVYEYIAECNTFDTAVNHLKELNIKPPNEVFARHLLATCGQKEEENIDGYIQRLQLLAKECNFKSVDAVQNRDDCIEMHLSQVYVRTLLDNGCLKTRHCI